MPIFHPSSLSKKSLEEKGKELGITQILLIEKCLLALELTGRLQKHGLNFVFKGGTSLLLHFPKPKRLSIDVDILCLDGVAKLEEVLTEVSKEAPFTRWEQQSWRDRETPPTKHFQVYYNSRATNDANPSIQIDLIQAESLYAKLEDKPIVAPFGEVIEAIDVPTPSSSSLLGDKLATLAPSTIGYLYQPITRSGADGEPRPIKVAKHLFDIGELGTVASNLQETIDTYQKVHKEQLLFREREYTIEECLNDTQDVAHWVCFPRVPKDKDALTKFNYMRDGLANLNSHLFTTGYGHAGAKIAAGTAALVAEIVRQNKATFDLPTFLAAPWTREQLRESKLEGQWEFLNKLHRTDPDSFKCWLIAQQMKLNQG